MRVSGFTIVRGAVSLGYPFLESILSLLPLVDEFIVGIGDGDDGTWEAVQEIQDPRLKPFRSEWAAATTGSDILSQQTNIALARCSGDWGIYLQADEVVHEDDLDIIPTAMRRHLPRRTEGLLFRYHHFWREYGLVSDDWLWFYPRAVRAVKLGIGIVSAGDACGFVRHRPGTTRGLLKADSGARIFHYGWCNSPGRQVDRIRGLREVFALPADPRLSTDTVFGPMATRRYRGTHPHTMRERIAATGRATATEPTARSPALLRALIAVLREPRAARGWARPLFPVSLTNAWWTAMDLLKRPR